MDSEAVLKKYPIYGPACNKYWTLEQIRTKTFNTKYSRHVEDEMEYQLHKQWAKEFFSSIENYIQTVYIDPLEPFILIKNRFPYKIPPFVKHYLLWLKPGINLSDNQINAILEKKFPNSQIVWWQNGASERSVFTVTHYQVFISF